MGLFAKLLSFFLFLIYSAVSHAQTFYVCDSTGSDSHLGRSEAMPFKTYAKAMANFNKLTEGGSILFCRGETFNVEKVPNLANTKCRSSAPCTIGAYGDESLARPIILTNGTHAINFENGGDARQDGGYRVENLTLMSTRAGGAGIRLYNDVDDVTISNVHIEGFNIGVQAAGSNKVAVGNAANGMNDRLVIQNSTIIRNAKQGFLGSCNDCDIENNIFENNGRKALLDHNIYLAHTGTHAKGIRIRNNALYKSAIVNGKCEGVSLVGHGHLEDVLIEGNLINEDLGKASAACWGVSIDSGYSKVDESFRNIVIRNNKIINVGGHAIGCASCDGVVIEGNEILDEGKVTFVGIKVPVRTEDTLKSRNIKVLNNKIVLSHESSSGVWLGGESLPIVAGNEVSLPITARSNCVSLNQASINSDISTNVCTRHNGVTIIDNRIQPEKSSTTEGSQASETEPAESQSASDVTIIDNAPQPEQPVTAGNSQVVESGSAESQSASDVTVFDNKSQFEKSITVENSQAVETELVESQFVSNEQLSDGTSGHVESLANASVSSEQPVQEESLADEIEKKDLDGVDEYAMLSSSVQNETSATNKKNGRGASDIKQGLESATSPRSKQAYGGAGGGSSSKTLAKSQSNEQLTDEGGAYFETIVQSVGRSTGKHVFGNGDIEVSTIQNASPSIIKMKDVIQASQEDLSEIEPDLCRASAHGKCLMR